MAVLTTIVVVLGAWCATSVITAALYTAVRTRHIRRQRATGSVLDGAARPCTAAAEPADLGISAQSLAGSDARPG
ncbi:hypothetical protein OG429_36840 [Streptomyces sp. NBC_00190]|uniref:hypothetical protein n=1 Tax=unclassified Streptomyces TaxID=2593676 RepID=UPI002E280436|nr:hypothetical protein [Streptomyces sp. NBC_00190]WSZ44347.1 hypothetical protein OG239_39305 [Streptomyces sp. NBC_00868]